MEYWTRSLSCYVTSLCRRGTLQCTKLAIAEYVQPLFPFRQSSTVFLVGSFRSQLAPETQFQVPISANATINVRPYVLRIEFSKRLSIQLPQLQRTHQISRAIIKGPRISWQRSHHLRSACDERTFKDGINETLTVPESVALAATAQRSSLKLRMPPSKQDRYPPHTFP